MADSPHKFFFFEDEKGNYAEFECGNCAGDIDMEHYEVPAEKSEYECPYCNAVLSVEYVK